MKKYFLLILSLIFIPMVATAISGTANSIGGTTYYHFSDGTSGSSNNIGGTTYFNFSDGSSGTAVTLGGKTYYNYNTYITDNLNHYDNEKIKLFQEQDKYVDTYVFNILNNLSSDQCKLYTLKQYDNFKKVLKLTTLTAVEESAIMNQSAEDYLQRYTNAGVPLTSPSAISSALQDAITQKNNFLLKMNAIYQDTMMMFDTIKTYTTCLNTDCPNGYNWNSNKTACTENKITCPENSTPSFNNNCICNIGYKYNSENSACIKDSLQENNGDTKAKNTVVATPKVGVPKIVYKSPDSTNTTTNTALVVGTTTTENNNHNNIIAKSNEETGSFQKFGKKIDRATHSMTNFLKRIFVLIKFW